MTGITIMALGLAVRVFPPADQLPARPEMPDPLVMLDGSPVTSKKMWREKRRPELKALFEHYMYGSAPPAPAWGRTAPSRARRSPPRARRARRRSVPASSRCRRPSTSIHG